MYIQPLENVVRYFDIEAINVVILLLSLTHLFFNIYFIWRRPNDLLLLPSVFMLYIFSSVLTNMFYIYGYLNKVSGYICYIVFQLSMFHLILSILWRNDKFKNWLLKLIKVI